MKVAVCVMVKNEERDFLEWLCFHLAVGFDTILVYDNYSTDRTFAVAASAKAVGDVRVRLWDTPGKFRQYEAYRDALRTYRDEFDWIAFIDSDEFLFAPDHRPIKAVLATLEHAGAVGVHWQCFGSSGVQSIGDKLLIEEFLHRSLEHFTPNKHIKTIVRPELATGECSPHHFVLTEGELCTRADGRPIEDFFKPGKTRSVGATDILRINHYYTRSREQYARKLARGRCNGQEVVDDFDYMDRNEVFDDSAIIYLDEVKALVRQVADQASVASVEGAVAAEPGGA